MNWIARNNVKYYQKREWSNIGTP